MALLFVSMDPGAVLKRERKARGVSQDALGKMIGKTTSAVAQYEAGRIQPLREVAAAIDEALGTGSTIASAFGFTQPGDLESRVAELERHVGVLLQRQKAVVQRTARPPRRRASDTQ